jgi:hypothetical protein
MQVSLSKIDNKYKWIFLFGLWCLHGIMALWQYLPPDGNIGSFLANSTLRLFTFVVLMLLIIVTMAAVLLALWKKLDWLAWEMVFQRSRTRDIILLSGLFALFLSSFLLVVFDFSAGNPSSLTDDYIRVVMPLLSLMFFISIEIIVLILISEFGNKTEAVALDRIFLTRFLIVLSILGALSAVVYSTGLGVVDSYVGDWSRGIPAVPLFEWHILLACVVSVAAALLELRDKLFNYKYLDLAVCVLIWLATMLIWLGQPTEPNAAALGPHAPNFEIYPFNDAQIYDQSAQSALIGIGFGDRVPPRALYIAFLIINHVLVGQDYESLIRFQTVFFAFFPVLLYLLGAKFFGRPVGVGVALFAIFRDFTSNLVSSFTGNLTYSKLLMSEIPTAMFLILFLLLAFRWIKQDFPLFVGFIMGGVLGLAMLIRTQASVALPVVILFGLFVSSGKVKPLIRSVLVMGLAVIITVSPWLWRNWSVTGQLMFDSPEYQMSNMALRYGRLNGMEADIALSQDETYTEYSARLNDMAATAIQANPPRAVWAVANSFLNHGVNNILLFPLRYELSTMREFWIPKTAFWEWWHGEPSNMQSALLALYISLFGLGVSVAWYRLGLLGLLPLGLNLAYNMWTSLALLSGQRFMVAMDWSIYMYYMVGIFSLIGGVALLLTSGRPAALAWMKKNSQIFLHYHANVKTVPLWHYVFAACAFLLLGASPPIMESLFPQRYTYLPHEEIIHGIVNSPALALKNVDSSCVQKLADDSLLNYTQGRALYPRYYLANEGERITDAIGYKVVNEGRLVFEFIGQENYRVVFPLSETPEYFPHTSDVTLIYGQDDTLWFLFVEQDSRTAFYVSDYFDHAVCD